VIFSNMALYLILVNLYMHISIIKIFRKYRITGMALYWRFPMLLNYWFSLHKRQGGAMQKYTKSSFVRYLSNYFNSFSHVHIDGRLLITYASFFGKLNLLTYVLIFLALFLWITCPIALSSPAYYLKQENIFVMNMCQWNSVLHLESDRELIVFCKNQFIFTDIQFTHS
jgi:hypothetical protein